jgi:hypothetical protein
MRRRGFEPLGERRQPLGVLADRVPRALFESRDMNRRVALGFINDPSNGLCQLQASPGAAEALSSKSQLSTLTRMGAASELAVELNCVKPAPDLGPQS